MTNQMSTYRRCSVKQAHIKAAKTDQKTDQLNLCWHLPPLGGLRFYNRFERFTNQASGFAGGR